MLQRFVRFAAIAALVVIPALGPAPVSAEVVRVNPAPARSPRPQGMGREQRGEQFGMGLVMLIGGVGVVGYWVLKSRRDD